MGNPYANDMTASAFNHLITEKITLKKNEPVYLAAWTGTTKGVLHSIGSEKRELPAGIEEAEIAFCRKYCGQIRKKLHFNDVIRMGEKKVAGKDPVIC